MAFWKMAFNQKWVTAEQLRLAVVTESNPYGEITVEEYREITNKEFY